MFSVFLGASTSVSDASVPFMQALDREAIRENSLTTADILAVSRASLQSSTHSDMESYVKRMTICHIEVLKNIILLLVNLVHLYIYICT